MSTMPTLKRCPDCGGTGMENLKRGGPPQGPQPLRQSPMPLHSRKCPACDGDGQRFVCDHPGCTQAPVQFDELTGEGFCAEHPKGNL